MGKPIQETSGKAVPTQVFKCPCNASARFTPVYRFSLNLPSPQIVMGENSPPAVKCISCGQLYVWNKVDAGWDRESPLDDLIKLEAAGG